MLFFQYYSDSFRLKNAKDVRLLLHVLDYQVSPNTLTVELEEKPPHVGIRWLALSPVRSQFSIFWRFR